MNFDVFFKVIFILIYFLTSLGLYRTYLRMRSVLDGQLIDLRNQLSNLRDADRLQVQRIKDLEAQVWERE